MADVDVVAARREARRQRILQNADDRLKRITYDNTESSPPSIANFKQPPATAVDKAHIMNTNVLTDNNAETSHHHNNSPIQPGAAKPVMSHNLNLGQTQSRRGTGTSTSNYRALIILLLGIAIRYINLIFENCEEMLGIDLSILRINQIFVPFLLFEASEFVLFRPTLGSSDGSSSNSSTLQLLLALYNIKGGRFTVFINMLSRILLLLKDASIYLFAFVFLDMLFSVFNVEDAV